MLRAEGRASCFSPVVMYGLLAPTRPLLPSFVIPEQTRNLSPAAFQQPVLGGGGVQAQGDMQEEGTWPPGSSAFSHVSREVAASWQHPCPVPSWPLGVADPVAQDPSDERAVAFPAAGLGGGPRRGTSLRYHRE